MPNGRWGVFPADEEPPGAIRTLAAEVEKDGGAVLGLYREPVGGGWHIVALLPLAQVEATPYQRDLSPSHAKRLREVIKKLDRFVDPIVVVRHGPGEYWTPNGNHRRDALQKLKARHVPVILIPDERVAFQILALNTEKAHNLKEKSLEVIRMVRALMETEPRSAEEVFAFQLEEAHFITLGLLYEKRPRFAGSVHAPILRRVDAFLKQPLAKAYEERVRRAEVVDAADALLGEVAARLKRRGITHPYVKNFVMARVNPLTRARKSLPTFDQTWEKIQAALERFDVEKIRAEDVARAAGPAAA
ncbi:MAG TPA: ParB N-terminal domain-containing protein [Candidatus Sulfotelmatobacter sp.]|nr:ParB N-terminal domain-containing protein [Candidatus Sulfotelmatobacter sp.]